MVVDLRAGQLTPIHLPTPIEEAFRDLVRTREAVVYDRRRVRQRMQSALLRWGIRRSERFIAWSPRWRTWIRTIHPESEWAQSVWDEWLSQLEALDARVTRLERLIQTAMSTHPHSSLLVALQALREIDWLTSATLVSEFGDFAQFAHPRAVMSSVGLVPREASGGSSRRQDPITKTGNAHVRRVLVEAAHSYRYPPTKQGRTAQRVGKAPVAWLLSLHTIDWWAQHRLHARLRRRSGARGKAQAVTAVTRELCGYCWEIAVWVRAETRREEAVHASTL
ncbi:MAG: transposase [Firmicutes bacterium]|nr:transposase [Bacillota bacterium]MCL5066555.1 transposase [Bacillota bacterium]